MLEITLRQTEVVPRCAEVCRIVPRWDKWTEVVRVTSKCCMNRRVVKVEARDEPRYSVESLRGKMRCIM